MKLKNLIITFILILIILLETINIKPITNFFKNLINNNKTIIINPKNEYYKDYDFLFIKNTDNYTPYSYNDLLNIFYSVINNGWDEFTFYCPSEYSDCINDVELISNNQVLLSQINDFASPFNSFDEINTLYDETGEITISLNNTYTKEEQNIINEKLDSIISSNINDSMTLEQKLKSLHDYIINTTKYDIDKNNTGESIYHSSTAYGALIDGFATCNGYADAYALILDRLGVKNYRITSDTHIWNAVYFNDEWLHIDLTWDDPVSESGKDYLEHNYFLVDNDTLEKEDGTLVDHKFPKAVYLEFKNT